MGIDPQPVTKGRKEKKKSKSIRKTISFDE